MPDTVPENVMAGIPRSDFFKGSLRPIDIHNMICEITRSSWWEILPRERTFCLRRLSEKVGGGEFPWSAQIVQERTLKKFKLLLDKKLAEVVESVQPKDSLIQKLNQDGSRGVVDAKCCFGRGRRWKGWVGEH